MCNTYHVSAWKTYKKETNWWFVNVTVESDEGKQDFEFIYHDKPEEKTVKVCMNRALRAFCLHQLDELNNPFDKNNPMIFGYNKLEVTQKNGWTQDPQSDDSDPIRRSNL